MITPVVWLEGQDLGGTRDDSGSNSQANRVVKCEATSDPCMKFERFTARLEDSLVPNARQMAAFPRPSSLQLPFV